MALVEASAPEKMPSQSINKNIFTKITKQSRVLTWALAMKKYYIKTRLIDNQFFKIVRLLLIQFKFLIKNNWHFISYFQSLYINQFY